MSDARNDLPLMLTRQQAADLCGLTYSGFGTWMAKGKVPKAAPGTRRWNTAQLLLAIQDMSGVKPDHSSLSPDNDNSPNALSDKWFKDSGYEGAT
jgi:hypothetical protein